MYVETCRDRFQARSEYESFVDFYFCHRPGRSDDVIEFMKMVELVAKVEEEDALVISKTDLDNVVHVRMSKWWKQRVRRSLLTAFLRCSDAFKERSGPSFVKTIFSRTYTEETREAIERFLDGYTLVKYSRKKEFSGWWELFKVGGNSKKILVKKRKNEHKQKNG